MSNAKYKKVPTDQLLVDDRYQRPLDEKRVQTMVRTFDARQFGTLEASQRNGHAAVFDGQHRLAVAKELGLATVPCLVHADLTPEEESDLFVALQRNRRGITQLDRFRARLFSGDQVAKDIEEIVERHGFKLDRGGRDSGRLGVIQAITSVERVHRRGLLDPTLGLLATLWFGDDKSTDGGLIEGLALTIEGYANRMGPTEVGRLEEASPMVILRRSVGHAGGGSAKGVHIAKEIRKVAGLRGRPSTKKEVAT